MPYLTVKPQLTPLDGPARHHVTIDFAALDFGGLGWALAVGSWQAFFARKKVL
jgi:hypothetical protein